MCAAQVSLASLFVRGFFARSALTATIPIENQERQGMAGEASYGRENLIAVSPRQVVKGGHLMDVLMRGLPLVEAIIIIKDYFK